MTHNQTSTALSDAALTHAAGGGLTSALLMGGTGGAWGGAVGGVVGGPVGGVVGGVLGGVGGFVGGLFVDEKKTVPRITRFRPI